MWWTGKPLDFGGSHGREKATGQGFGFCTSRNFARDGH